MDEQVTAKKILLSQKEEKRRSLMLEGDMFSALFLIALPLVFYASIGQIFQLIDTWIAANISANVVSTVSFVVQIEKMILAISSGLSIAGGVIISRSYGAGDMEKVKRETSTLFFLCLFIGLFVLAVVIPLMYPLLLLLKMPEQLIGQGTLYSSLVVVSIIFQFINTIYFSIQKSRGNTKIIMWGNLLVLGIKTALNIVTISLISQGIFSRDKGIFFLPIATIIAHSVLTVIAVINLTSKDNPFRISIKNTSFSKEFIKPLTNLGIPVFLEKFIFAFGKAIVNSLCAGFGPTVVGALGVSDRICGLATNPPSGVQEAESSLISNNLGNKNIKRALGFFYRSILLNITYVLIVFALTGIFKAAIIHAFAKGDAAFSIEIDKIYTWERLDTILIALNVSVMGLLYGFGKTKVSMVINIARLFAYRIPVLLLFMKVPFLFNNLGTQAVGIAMLVSNSLTGITAGITAFIFIRKLKKDSSLAAL